MPPSTGAVGEHHALLMPPPSRSTPDDADASPSSSSSTTTSRVKATAMALWVASIALAVAVVVFASSSSSSLGSTRDAASLGAAGAVPHTHWRGMTMTSSLGYEIDLAPCHAFADELEAHARAFSAQALAKLRDITWIDGFWASPPSEEQHHALEYYLLGIGRTSCAAGVFGMNVVFMRDSAGACEDAMSAYARGRVIRGESVPNQFGRGAVRCVVKPREHLTYTNMTECGVEQFKRVWINKVPLVNEMANEIEGSELFKDLRSKRYFWLDADIGLLQCPDHTAYSFCMSIGAPEYYRERVGFPPFKWLHETLHREASEDKMMLNCYRNEFQGSAAANAATNAEDNDVDDDDSYLDSPVVGKDVAALAKPRPAFGTCDDIHRISVIANMFGGSKRAINEYTKGYMHFIDFHIPNTANMGSPQKPIECSCPSEENIMSTMAIYDHYRKLTSDASCARQEHGQVYPVDTFKTKLVSEIED